MKKNHTILINNVQVKVEIVDINTLNTVNQYTKNGNTLLCSQTNNFEDMINHHMVMIQLYIFKALQTDTLFDCLRDLSATNVITNNNLVGFELQSYHDIEILIAINQDIPSIYALYKDHHIKTSLLPVEFKAAVKNLSLGADDE